MSLLFEEIPLSPKLEPCSKNQDQIRNQRFRLRRNTLFLRRKAGGGDGVSKPVPFDLSLVNTRLFCLIGTVLAIFNQTETIHIWYLILVQLYNSSLKLFI